MGTKKSRHPTVGKRILFIVLWFFILVVAFCFIQKRINAELYVQDYEYTITDMGDSSLDRSPTETGNAVVAVGDGSPKKNGSSAEVSADHLEDTSSSLVLFYDGLEVPVCGLKHNAEDHELRKYEHYSICYRESYEQAEWSAYMLSDSQLEKNTSRTDDFRPDLMISTQSASLADYKGSGYDRGHLTPAADMAFSDSAMSETFFMSNMSPQAPQFNRGVWKYLESQVRDWVKTFGRVYVVSGPILEKAADEYEFIGKNKVSVPEYYYKVILVPLFADETDRLTMEDAESAMAIGFIMPNQKCEGTFWDYAVSVEEVEKRTGLDFYSFLDDSIEEVVENDYVVENWK